MISSLNNATVKATVRLRKRRERDRRNAFLVEGHRAVAAALSAGVRLHEVFHLRGARPAPPLVEAAKRAGASTHEVSPAVMAHLTDLGHAPGVLAVAPLNPKSPDAAARGDFTVVLCGIHDPAVAGGVLAAAAGAGATGAISTASTTDLFAPPCVRAAAGAHFAFPVAPDADAKRVASLIAPRPVFALCGEGTPVCSASMDRPCALLVCQTDVPEAFSPATRVRLEPGAHGVGPGPVAAAAVALYRVGCA